MLYESWTHTITYWFRWRSSPMLWKQHSRKVSKPELWSRSRYEFNHEDFTRETKNKVQIMYNFPLLLVILTVSFVATILMPFTMGWPLNTHFPWYSDNYDWSVGLLQSFCWVEETRCQESGPKDASCGKSEGNYYQEEVCGKESEDHCHKEVNAKEEDYNEEDNWQGFSQEGQGSTKEACSFPQN